MKQVSLLLITGCFRTGLGYPDSKIPRAPWMTHVCASHGPHVGCHWSMHTWVSNNFPRGTHGFCLSKDPHGTQMKPMCNCHLYGPCWATMWLPLWGHTWAATKGHTGVCNNFPCGAHVFCLSKVPTWHPHKTHVCLQSALPMLDKVSDQVH